jgi:septum formation protein
MTQTAQIYLASSSPRRQELLQQMGVSFLLTAQFVDEFHKLHETPESYVKRLALEKALDGFSRQAMKDRPVLGADTAVVINDRILGKPENREHAIDTLMLLSGKTHQVMSSVALVNQHQSQVALSISKVTFQKLSKQQCEQYWETGEPQDKAGSYGIQGKGAIFISNLNGSYSGVMGLPVHETAVLLERFNITLL